MVTGDRPVERAVNAVTSLASPGQVGDDERDSMQPERSIYQYSAGASSPCGRQVLDVMLPTTIAVIGREWERTIRIGSESEGHSEGETASQRASGESVQQRWPRQQSFVPNPTTPPYGEPSDSLAKGLEVFQLQRHQDPPRPKCYNAKYPIAKQRSPEGRSGENKDPRARRNSAKETRPRI